MIIRNGKPVSLDKEKKEEKERKKKESASSADKSSEPNYWGGDLFKKKK